MITGYKILRATSADELEELVLEKLKDGWWFHGYVLLLDDTFYQAMVLRPEEKDSRGGWNVLTHGGPISTAKESE